MLIITEYKLNKHTSAMLEIPADARLLSVGILDGELMLWAEVETTSPRQRREFNVFESGESIARSRQACAHKYVASAYSGVFAWHVYEHV